MLAPLRPSRPAPPAGPPCPGRAYPAPFRLLVGLLAAAWLLAAPPRAEAALILS